MGQFFKKHRFYAIASFFLLLVCGVFFNKKSSLRFDPNFRLGVIFTSSVMI